MIDRSPKHPEIKAAKSLLYVHFWRHVKSMKRASDVQDIRRENRQTCALVRDMHRVRLETVIDPREYPTRMSLYTTIRDDWVLEEWFDWAWIEASPGSLGSGLMWVPRGTSGVIRNTTERFVVEPPPPVPEVPELIVAGFDDWIIGPQGE